MPDAPPTMTAFLPSISTVRSFPLLGGAPPAGVLSGASLLVRLIRNEAALRCARTPGRNPGQRVYYFARPNAEPQRGTMERETILFDVADNVATITLNRPDSLNSFNNAMADDMTWAWETVRDTDDIHCVVLQANGERAFCTGIDIKGGGDWFMTENVWNSFDPGITLAPKIHHRVWKPVVTAVHGLCAGGASTSSTSPTSSSAPRTPCSSTRTPTSGS